MWGANEDDYGSKKVEEGSEYDSKRGRRFSDDSLEESNDQGDGEHFQKGQADVPAEEMLSDDYYEQDGEEHSDSLHGRVLSQPSTSGSRLPSMPTSSSRNIPKNLKTAKYDEYDFKMKTMKQKKKRLMRMILMMLIFEPDFGEINSRSKEQGFDSCHCLTASIVVCNLGNCCYC
ncbi:hypothetical protein HPP92_006719 [Vanilla planifolia]|uniref:Uncharacterized protein n=1 Tax=Vanilla planifolia TaxID=51239 RepID=A0A835RKF7_VANPL|nr:hypothetical protein HPP92_006719 [Vanilla planifolia]